MASQQEIDLPALLCNIRPACTLLCRTPCRFGSMREAFALCARPQENVPNGFAFLQATGEEQDAEVKDPADLAKGATNEWQPRFLGNRVGIICSIVIATKCWSSPTNF